MSSDFLEKIPDGSALYVRPVGFVSGLHAEHTAAFDYRGSGRRFTGFVLYTRCPDGSVLSSFIPAHHQTDIQTILGADAEQQVSKQLGALARPHAPLALTGGRVLPFTRPLVMGVLNVTPDSFSDGGQFLDAGKAIRHGRAMVAAGADIIDIGGESTRPGADPVWEGEEADRVVPVIEALAADGVTLSIDSRNAFVMEKALAAGAHIVNDVSALTHDPDSLSLVARTGAPVVLMHAQADPRTMQDDPIYDHVLLDVYDYLAARIKACEAAGIDRRNIIVDPGIGFGKRVVKDNLALINGLLLFQTLGCPVLLGASRKRFIGAITGVDDAEDRMAGSLAAAIIGAELGADIVRVHDVQQTAEALKVIQVRFDAYAMDGFD